MANDPDSVQVSQSDEVRVYETPALSPLSRNISMEDAKRIDLMGNIQGSMVPNAQFNQICECAELMGIRLQLSYDVPTLENPAMYPVEENCVAHA